MSKISLISGSIIAATIMLAPGITLAAPFAQPDSSSVPLLSGTYVVTFVHVCQPTETVTYSQQDNVQNIKISDANDEMDAGKMVLKQGATPGSGTATFDLISANGSPFLVKNSGKSGSSGNPMGKNTGSGSATFKQTSSTIEIKESSGTTTYNIYYGKVSGGVVQYAVIGGVDDNDCATEGSLTIN